MKDKISDKELTKFGLLIGLIFVFIIGLIFPTIMGYTFRKWTLIPGLPLIILSLLRPAILKLPYKLWMKLGFLLGWINSRLILGIIFIIVVQPIAIFMKILGYDPLKKKFDYNKETYRENNYERKIDMNRIF